MQQEKIGKNKVKKEGFLKFLLDYIPLNSWTIKSCDFAMDLKINILDLDLNNAVNKIKESKFVTNFIEELGKALNNKEVKLDEGEIYVVYELRESKNEATLIKSSTGEQVNVEKEKIQKEIPDLELGDNVKFENGNFSLYTQKVELSNRAWSILEPLYFNLKLEDGRKYKVTKIENNNIQICDTKTNVKYTENREEHPDWNVGDELIVKDEKYVKISE